MPKRRSRLTQTARHRKAAPKTKWWEIRRIIDERPGASGAEYLVDWEDDPKTGERFDPTWSDAVTDKAKHEWLVLKAARAQVPSELSNAVVDTVQGGACASSSNSRQDPRQESSQDSQPPRPANFRQAKRTAASALPRSLPCSPESQSEPRRKTPRLRYSYSPSAEPVPSIISAASPATTSDLPEFDQERESFIVGLPKDPLFESSDYLSVSVANSQNTQSQSRSIIEQEEQDSRLLLSSHLSQSTIPDSQEYSVQLSGASQLYNSEGVHISSPGKSQKPSGQSRSGLVSSGSNTTGRSSSGPASGISHIPSHQDIPSSHGIQAQVPSQLPETHQSGHTASRDSGSHPKGTPAQSSSGDRVRFLTQLDYETNFSIASSSYKSQISESPRVLVAEGSGVGSQLPLDNSRRSQDAQVIDRIHPVLDKITDSNETRSSMADNGNTDTPSRRSAVDELNDIFTLGSTVPDSASAPAPAEPHQQSSAAEVEANEPPMTFATAPDAAAHSQEPAQLQVPSHPDAGREGTKATQASESSGTQELQNIIDMAFSTQDAPLDAPSATQTLLPLHPHVEEQVTISPAEILGSAMPGLESQGLMPPPTFESSSEQVPFGQKYQQSRSASSSSVGPAQMQHVVTLPFQASLRPQYETTLIEQKRDVTTFGGIFSSEEFVEPDRALVERIDDLFSKLYSLCDYPQDIVGTVLEDLTPAEQIKYACNANSKVCFLFELLQGIETDTKILIIARSRELLRVLGHLADALEIGRTSTTLEQPSNDFSDSAASVTLALPEEEFDIEAFDLVIGYDHGFGTSPVARALSPASQTGRPPMVLTLVTAYSIEHIDMELPDNLDLLERKNALLYGIVKARRLIDDPDRGYPEPHELAGLFCDCLNGKAEDIIWEPIALPDDILDVYLGSQSKSQVPTSMDQENARKRKLDDSDEEDVKRMRMIPRESIVRADDIPLPDDVQWLLQSVVSTEHAQHGRDVLVKVRLSAMQALSEKLAETERTAAAGDATSEYKRIIENLEARVTEYERTSSKTYKSYRAAVEDRTKFERQTKKAETDLQLAKDSAEKERAKAQGKIQELEEKVARLTAGAEGSEESPLAVSEKLLKEAQDKVQSLEKRLENAKADGEYAKNMYQEASGAGTALRGENNELREKNEELSKQTEDTLGKIHQMQADSAAKAYLGQIEELKAQIREREVELDRTRDELRQLKNGRRETRQVSVPRSPRMGLMSPRPPGRPYGGSTSRGTSPTPGVEGPLMGTIPAPGNGRWNHLRE